MPGFRALRCFCQTHDEVKAPVFQSRLTPLAPRDLGLDLVGRTSPSWHQARLSGGGGTGLSHAAGQERLPEDMGARPSDAGAPRVPHSSVIKVFPFRPSLWSKKIFWVFRRFY